MSGLFGNLETSKRALNASQAAISTTGHNIANLDTEGYSKQTVILQASTPLTQIFGQVGKGVDIRQIQRQSDDLLFSHLIDTTAQSGEWERNAVLTQEIEAIFNEPTDFGLNNTMTDFFSSWSDLASNPEMKSFRMNVVEKSQNLVDNLNRLDSELWGMRQRVGDQISDRITNLNNFAQEVAELNIGIARVETSQRISANDLRDKRDQLLLKMATIIDIKTKEFENGMVKVTVNGVSIVENDLTFKLQADQRMVDTQFDEIRILVADSTGKQITITSGEIKGLLNIRDDFLVDQINNLNNLSVTLANEVNKIHLKGYGNESNESTGLFFFNPQITGAKNIQMSTPILQDPNKIAASASGAAGDNQIALAIAELKDKKTMDNQSMTFSRFYETVTNEIGQKTQIASSNKKNQDMLTDQVKNFKETISGVQLDAELTTLIRLQSAYQAAARVVTTVDTLLNTVINSMAR